MSGRPLPINPSLEQLRKQAKEFRDRVRAGHPKLTGQVRELHPRWAGASDASTDWARFTLADAQLVLARYHGFPSWRRLREYVEVARYSRSLQRRPADGGDLVEEFLVEEFLRLACLTGPGGYYNSPHVGTGEEVDDPQRQADARRLLAAHPQLASATIHTAAAVGDIAAARSLLAAEESLANYEGGPHRWPPLLYLAFSRLNSTETGHSTLEVARLLLAHGADPNAGYLPNVEPSPGTPGPVPVTALSRAFRGRQDPINQPPHQHSLPLARLLLEAGADPNDAQALDNACGYPFDDAGLMLLLEHGLGRPSGGPWRAWFASWPDHRLLTPAELVQDALRYAAQLNLPNRVRLLLRRCTETGIDINTAPEAPDINAAAEVDLGQTAYERAVVAGNTEIVDLLTQAGARATPLDPTYQLLAACLRADRPAVHRLLAADPGLAERVVSTPWWPEPLAQAVALGRPEAVALLVSLGFPVSNWSLHLAALVGHLDVVRLLVELGADPTAESTGVSPHPPDDRTPLGFARYNHQDEVVAYLTHLTSAGPNPPTSSAS